MIFRKPLERRPVPTATSVLANPVVHLWFTQVATDADHLIAMMVAFSNERDGTPPDEARGLGLLLAYTRGNSALFKAEQSPAFNALVAGAERTVDELLRLFSDDEQWRRDFEGYFQRVTGGTSDIDPSSEVIRLQLLRGPSWLRETEED